MSLQADFELFRTQVKLRFDEVEQNMSEVSEKLGDLQSSFSSLDKTFKALGAVFEAGFTTMAMSIGSIQADLDILKESNGEILRRLNDLEGRKAG